jgi:hypothetical protein
MQVTVAINLMVTSVFAVGFYDKDYPDIGLQSAGEYLGRRFGSEVWSSFRTPKIHQNTEVGRFGQIWSKV